jgi:hypothetical protein
MRCLYLLPCASHKLSETDIGGWQFDSSFRVILYCVVLCVITMRPRHRVVSAAYNILSNIPAGVQEEY